MNIPQGREVQAESDQISTNPPANGTHSTPDARVAALRQSQSPKEVSTVGSGGKGHVA
jgi:hypothetical protein